MRIEARFAEIEQYCDVNKPDKFGAWAYLKLEAAGIIKFKNYSRCKKLAREAFNNFFEIKNYHGISLCRQATPSQFA